MIILRICISEHSMAKLYYFVKSILQESECALNKRLLKTMLLYAYVFSVKK